MSTSRLVATTAVLTAIAVALAALIPPIPAMTDAVVAAQRTVDTAGADALITAMAGLLAWAVWAWGALGLALTAASALPGIAGGVARVGLQVALPAGARRSAALLLGIGLGITAPLADAALPVLAATAAAAASPAGNVPDWPTPTTRPAGVPDWPAGADVAASPLAGDRVVVPGDCLWHIAADSLLGQLGGPPSNGEIASAVAAWWSANAAVIGADPDLLLPGQVLRAPGPP